jgi:hypothetical protein
MQRSRHCWRAAEKPISDHRLAGTDRPVQNLGRPGLVVETPTLEFSARSMNAEATPARILHSMIH